MVILKNGIAAGDSVARHGRRDRIRRRSRLRGLLIIPQTAIELLGDDPLPPHIFNPCFQGAELDTIPGLSAQPQFATGKTHAPRNRTITLSEEEQRLYRRRLIKLHEPSAIQGVLDKTICQDASAALTFLPSNSVDLLFADPPYNLSKSFNERKFNRPNLTSVERLARFYQDERG